MDPPALTTQLDDLTAQIDDLSDVLSPLLKAPLSSTASTLPLLDKAKLYIHLAYTIESLLFSTLLTAGQNAKAHPVFAELARLKTYFQKLQDAEHGPAQPTTKLDKDAAGRFIRHGLSGNDKYDRERRERMAGERTRAAEKARKLVNKKFDDGEESAKQAALPKEKRAAADAEDDEDESGEDVDVDVDAENGDDAAMNEAYDQEAASKGSCEQRQKRKKPGRKDENGRPKSREEMKAERRDKKTKKRQGRTAEAGRAPKTPGEAFKALAEGSVKKGNGKNGRGKK